MSSRENAKRKLVFLWPYTTWGGAQVYFLGIMKRARSDWDVIAAIPKGSASDLLELLDDLNVGVDFLARPFDPKGERSVIGKLRRQIDRIRSEVGVYLLLSRYDLRQSVVHLDIAPWQSWLLITMLIARGANVFSTIHNPPATPSRWRAQIWKARYWILSRLPRYRMFTANRATKAYLKDQLSKTFWEKVDVTPAAIDPEQIADARNSPFDLDSERSRFGIARESFVVLAVGQFIDRKGRWTFLEAASQLVNIRSNITFVWVMPSAPTREDARRIESFGLGSHFRPIVSNTIGKDRISILRFFRIADAFVLPSYVEGLPIALLEAMAMGIPSISTNIAAIPEAIEHRVTGFLIQPGNVQDLVKSILEIKGDAELRQRISDGGSQFVLKNFDERQTATICLDRYERCFFLH